MIAIITSQSLSNNLTFVRFSFISITSFLLLFIYI